jgi:predicted RNase H-like nuclease (RuvC/YqgF family)
MSQRDGFASGFLAGAFVGGVVGGILGALITSRLNTELTEQEENNLGNGAVEPQKTSTKRRMRASQTENLEMETARRSLEDKIAQLNATIDEVRKQLGNVNGNAAQTVSDRSSISE